MKTSNILILVLVAFVVAISIYDKIKLKEISENINREVPFGEYTNTGIINFSHVVVSGNNRGRVSFHQRGKDLLKYQDHFKDKFNSFVKNDTLYLSFDKKLTRNSYTDDRVNRLIVFYDTIQSLQFKNSNVYMWTNEQESLKVKAEGISFFRLHAMKLDKLDYDVGGKTETRFNFAKPSHIKNLTINAKEYSRTYLYNVITENPSIKTADSSKVDQSSLVINKPNL